MVASRASSGLLRMRRDMFTICRSLVPVTELMLRGRVRMSMMLGVCTQGILKCVPSPTGSASTPRNLSNTMARSPPSTVGPPHTHTTQHNTTQVRCHHR